MARSTSKLLQISRRRKRDRTGDGVAVGEESNIDKMESIEEFSLVILEKRTKIITLEQNMHSLTGVITSATNSTSSLTMSDNDDCYYYLIEWKQLFN